MQISDPNIAEQAPQNRLGTGVRGVKQSKTLKSVNIFTVRGVIAASSVLVLCIGLVFDLGLGLRLGLGLGKWPVNWESSDLAKKFSELRSQFSGPIERCLAVTPATH